jgi:hypothetical protein
VLGMPLYVCASGATPLVAVLMHKGMSAGAAVAFLVTGPASNITTFGVLSRLHGRRIGVLYVAAMTVVAVLVGYALDSALPSAAIPPLHDAAAHEAVAWWNVASLVAISALFLRSLIRQGPRQWIAQALPARSAG